MSWTRLPRDERIFRIKQQLDILYFTLFVLFNVVFTFVEPVPWLSVLLEDINVLFFIEIGVGLLVSLGIRIVLGRFVSGTIRREVAPVHEEYIFRVLFLGWINLVDPPSLQWGLAFLMVVVSSFLFSRAHPDDYFYFKQRFVAGIAWGVFFVVTGNYWACMASHLFFNMIGRYKKQEQKLAF